MLFEFGYITGSQPSKLSPGPLFLVRQCSAALDSCFQFQSPHLAGSTHPWTRGARLSLALKTAYSGFVVKWEGECWWAREKVPRHTKLCGPWSAHDVISHDFMAPIALLDARISMNLIA